MKDKEILERELAKLGAIGGFAGGFVPGAIGGYLGAKLAARYLPTETFEETFQISTDARTAFRTAMEVVQTVGSLLEEEEDDSPLPQISATVGSGFANMNPTLVYVTVSPVSESECQVAIVGAAKEGLIKQHSAKKAVSRVRDMMINACGSGGSGTAMAKS